MLGISGGIEPIFNFSYTRMTKSLHDGDVAYKVYTPIVKEYMENHNIKNEEDLPDFFVNAQTINPFKREKMQGVWQKHIDASISSTVNLPNSATVEEVEQLYIEAWKQGCKGLTIFRDGCERAAILTSTPEKKEEPKVEAKAKYFIRKTWADKKSQIGAYASLENAKKACDEAGKDFEVYDEKGKLIYPPAVGSEDFKIGDTVKLLTGAKWSTGSKIQPWVFNKTLYVREIRDNGILIVSTLPVGPITGSVRPNLVELIKPKSITTTTKKDTFKSYLVIITADTLNVRNGAGTQYKINTTVKKGQVYTIVDERNGWGKLKSGAGWIYLDKYTKKI
jgi:hypothetical protein